MVVRSKRELRITQTAGLTPAGWAADTRGSDVGRRMETMNCTARVATICAVAILASAGVLLAQEPSSKRRPTGPVDRKQCARCHPEVKAHAVTHGPVVVDGCAACHRTESVERHTFSTSDRVCVQCHKAPEAVGPVQHKPVAAGDCVGCHNPHGGANKAMLRSTSVNELCLACHDVSGGAKFAHAPATRCTDCHLPHSSKHAKLLRQPRAKICLECHKTIRKAVASARVGHAPTTDVRACFNCHAVHASDHPSLLVDEVNPLCLGCHEDVRAELDRAVHVHEPVVDASCTVCHKSHGSDNFRLLTAAYPETLYAEFTEENYALCFGCHDVEMITATTTTTSTGFRNGDVNLHHVHVGNRRTCRVCHRTHAGPNDRLVRESVAYGRAGYELRIGFEKTADGGGCAKTCHAPAAYTRLARLDDGEPR